ncbi:MAG: AraC family transcriptional regulator [Lachnospiraceae bacterium]|nr:AraC family transcriptional regulator [Lachnospiraceae bacterium]
MENKHSRRKLYEYAVIPGWWHGVAPLNYGYEECCSEYAFGPARRQYHLLHYVLEGKGTFCKEGKVYPVGQGDMFVILPEEVTTYQADKEKPWKYYWIGFEAEDTPEFLKCAVIRQPDVRQLFERARQGQYGLKNDGSVFTLLYEVLWHLSEEGIRKRKKENDYAAYTRTYLETMYAENVCIRKIAETLHIDRRYLTMLFHSAYGIPPRAYLLQVRLTQARTLLEQGYGVAETAEMTGFTDLSNFSRKYKKTYGICPSAQRNKGHVQGVKS